MSVLMTFRAIGDPAKLEASAAEQPELMQSLAEDAKRHGVISHRFYGTADGDIMVLDEWESEDGFHRFFAAHPEIKDLMAGVGVTQEPEVKFWRKLETHDEISPEVQLR